MRSNSTRRPESRHEVLPCVHCHKRRGWKTGGLCVRCHQDPKIRSAHGVVLISRCRTTAERFWEKVQKTEGCWEWIGYRTPYGYGSFGAGGRQRGAVFAHRFAYELINGPVPNGLCVLHRCDNPPCVRPDHLFLGTKKDNTQDMMEKKRHGVYTHPEHIRRGERHHRCRLTEGKVRGIRLRVTAGESRETLALEHGVSRATIDDIVNRRTWRHLP